MWRTARIATACTLFSGLVGIGLAGEPTAAPPAQPAAQKPALAVSLPPAPPPAPAAVAPPPAVAPPAVAAPKPAPTFRLLGVGEQTEFEIGAPAGQIHFQLEPNGARVRMTDPNGLTVELTRPSRRAIANGTAVEDPNAPQLKDLLVKSLIQSLATHRKVRMGRTQIEIQTAPKSAPAGTVPEPKIDLGTPGEIPADADDDAQSAAPGAQPPAKVRADVAVAPPAGTVPPAKIEEPALKEPAKEVPKAAVPRTVRIHRFAPSADEVEGAATVPLGKRTPEEIEKRKQETLRAAREEVLRRKQMKALQAEKARADGVKQASAEDDAAQPVFPAARRVEVAPPLEAVPEQAVPVQAIPVAPPAALTTKNAVPVPAAAPNAAADELATVQKELATLTNELEQLSHKRRVSGKSLQEVVRRIGETNQKLEAARKKLAQ